MDAKTSSSGLSSAALKALLPPPRPKLTVTLRNKFIAGLVILVPIVITVNVLWWLFQFVDGLAQPLFVGLVGRRIPGIGFIITIAIVFLAGVLFSTLALSAPVVDPAPAFTQTADVMVTGTVSSSDLSMTTVDISERS